MASQACENATPDDIADLKACIDRNAALVHLADDAMTAGKAVHTHIHEIAANSWATRLHEQIANQMQRYRAYTNHTQTRRDHALTEHRNIVAAIAADDPAHAHNLAFAHVLGARDEALRALGRTSDDVGAAPGR